MEDFLNPQKKEKAVNKSSTGWYRREYIGDNVPTSIESMCSVTKAQAEKANCNTAIWEAEDAVLQMKWQMRQKVVKSGGDSEIWLF